MRRKDREITAKKDLIAILENCKVCRLSMVDGNRPYMVPLNFGYDWQGDDLYLYFHSAKKGKKIDILNNNSQVCFEMDGKNSLIEGKTACEYSYAFESIIGFGTAIIVEATEKKAEALSFIMKHQAKLEVSSFPEEILDKVCIIKVLCAEICGKAHPL